MPIAAQDIAWNQPQIESFLERASRSLRTGRLSNGEHVLELERLLCTWTDCKFVVVTSSGGGALELMLAALDLQEKEVIVPTNTFAATALAAKRNGCKVVLADVSARTGCVTVDTISKMVTRSTAAVIDVHIGGAANPNALELNGYLEEKGILYLEDAAHSLGAAIGGVRVGSIGKCAAFSFFATKVVTSGEGGAVATNDGRLYERLKLLRNYGKPAEWTSYSSAAGFNFRMSEISAAAGVCSLEMLDENIIARRRVSRAYLDKLSNTGLDLIWSGESNGYKLIALLPDGVDKEDIKCRLANRGIALAGSVYDIPLHAQPIFQEDACRFPGSAEFSRRHICLPIYPGLSSGEVDSVAEALLEELG